jgi:hypothetical protein
MFLQDKCEDGTYQNTTGKSQCDRCPLGRFRDAAKITLLDGTENTGHICDICQLGTMTFEVGQKDCDFCPKGKYGKSTMNVLDVDGKIRDITRCENCPSGRRSHVEGATSIEACVACSSGRFQSETGGKNCINCETRYWTNSLTGTSSCELCPAGKYSVPNGDRCQSCESGQYQELTGQMNCDSCEDGTWTLNQENADQCVPCTSSQVFNIESRKCIECADSIYLDKFALIPGESQLECRRCPGKLCDSCVPVVLFVVVVLV